MPTANLEDHRHYMKLPMCGFCINAWDMIYMRQRPGSVSPQSWLSYCRVGGCDPDVWEYLDEETGWPIGFVLLDNGRPDWNETIEAYEPPDFDDTVFHRRLSDTDNARWRRVMPKLADAWNQTKGRGALDEHNSVPEEEIVWGDDDEEEVIEFIADDEIEW